LRNDFLTPTSGGEKPAAAMRESGECCYGAQTVVLGRTSSGFAGQQCLAH
jgi:hypothetical protein